MVESVIELAVNHELREANKKHPSTFQSRHEAYGVMLEEFEEAQDELTNCEWYLNEFKHSMKVDGDEFEKTMLKQLKQNAINLACEAVQISAMAQKALDSRKEW